MVLVILLTFTDDDILVCFCTLVGGPTLVCFRFVVSDSEASWIGSLMPLSALVGGLVGGLSLHRVGRKVTNPPTNFLDQIRR